MLENLNEIGKADRGRRTVSFGLALLVEALIIGAIVLTPLIFISVLPDGELLTFLIEPPPPPQPPAPPPPMPGPIVPDVDVRHVDINVAPPSIPTAIPPPDIDESTFFVPGPVNPAIVSGPASNLSVMTLPTPALPRIDVKAAPPSPPPPVLRKRIGGKIQNSRLIYQPSITYPPLAQKAHIEGEVIIDVVVDEEGKVIETAVKSGHPLLLQAALDAVKQYRYSPTLLNGEPIQVEADVKIIFKLKK